MKKTKLLLCALLTMTLASGLVACSPDGNKNDTVANESINETTDGTVNDNVPASDTSESGVKDSVAETAEASSTITYSGINSGMGIENSIYYATPIKNGALLDITAMDEICLTAASNDLCTGIKVDMSALKTDYIVAGLYHHKVYLGSGVYVEDEDKYEKELEIHTDFMNAYDSYYADREKYEEVDDITFCYEYGDFIGIKKCDDIYMCITAYNLDSDTSDEVLQNLKAEMLDIFANATFVENVEPEFATSCSYDSLAFACGWNVADIENVHWRNGDIAFEYTRKSESGSVTFNIKKLSAADMAESLESEDEEKYEVLTDAAGKEIGYIDTYERDERNMRYCIRLDDGSYMDLDIYTVFYEGFPDIHEWSEVEDFLCSGN